MFIAPQEKNFLLLDMSELQSPVREVHNLNLRINNNWNSVKEMSLFKYFNMYTLM